MNNSNNINLLICLNRLFLILKELGSPSDLCRLPCTALCTAHSVHCALGVTRVQAYLNQSHDNSNQTGAQHTVHCTLCAFFSFLTLISERILHERLMPDGPRGQWIRTPPRRQGHLEGPVAVRWQPCEVHAVHAPAAQPVRLPDRRPR